MTSPQSVADTVSVELPIAGREARMGLAIFYLLLGTSYIVPFWHEARLSPARQIENMILGTLLVLMGLVTFCIGLSKVTLSVTSDTLILRTSALGIRWVKCYSLSEMSNLRVDRRRIFTSRP